MASVFIAFIVIGLAIPVLPLHVHRELGLGTFLVGLVAGSQFAAAILSRVWAGRDADIRGSKHAVVAGLVIAAIAGLLYFLSLTFFTKPVMSVVILLLGRASGFAAPEDCTTAVCVLPGTELVFSKNVVWSRPHVEAQSEDGDIPESEHGRALRPS
jgi:MFS family permease